MKTIDAVIEQCEEIANASKQHTLHMTHFSQSYDEWAEEWTQIAEWLKELKAYKEQCGDAINRQAVLDINESHHGQLPNHVNHQIWDEIKALPSVTPQQRTGRWIKQNYGWNWQCSECGFVTPPSAKEIFTFCPKCGCKMEVEE